MKPHTKAKIELAIDEAVRITESYVIEFVDSSAEERRNRINDLKEKLGVLKTCPNCGSPNVIMFTADNDICKNCDFII